MRTLLIGLIMTASTSTFAVSATGYKCLANGIKWSIEFEESVKSDSAGLVVREYYGEINQDSSLGTSGPVTINYGGTALNNAEVKFFIIDNSLATLIPYDNQSEYQYQMVYRSIHSDCEIL